MITSVNEFKRLINELRDFNFISSESDRNSLIDTIDLMVDVLNNQFFDENSENALDDPDNIQAILDLKSGKVVRDGEYLSESIDALIGYFESAEKQKVWGDTSWTDLLGWIK